MFLPFILIPCPGFRLLESGSASYICWNLHSWVWAPFFNQFLHHMAITEGFNPFSAKCNLKECNKTSQSTSGSLYYFWRVCKCHEEDRLLTRSPVGTPRRHTKGSCTQETCWRGKMVRHTDTLVWMHPANCAWFAEGRCQLPVESVPTPLYCKNFNLPAAVPWCWKLPAQVLNMIWIWIEKAGDAAWILHFSFHLSVMKFHF